jgi:hypothetical protein
MERKYIIILTTRRGGIYRRGVCPVLWLWLFRLNYAEQTHIGYNNFLSVIYTNADKQYDFHSTKNYAHY